MGLSAESKRRSTSWDDLEIGKVALPQSPHISNQIVFYNTYTFTKIEFLELFCPNEWKLFQWCYLVVGWVQWELPMQINLRVVNLMWVRLKMILDFLFDSMSRKIYQATVPMFIFISTTWIFFPISMWTFSHLEKRTFTQGPHIFVVHYFFHIIILHQGICGLSLAFHRWRFIIKEMISI